MPDVADQTSVTRLLRALLTEEGRQDPFAVYERLRQRGTVVATPPAGYWVTSYRWCERILKDPAWHSVDAAWRDRHQPGWRADPGRVGLSRMLLALNGPEHTAARRWSAGHFSAGALAARRPVVAQLVAAHVDRLVVALRGGAVVDAVPILDALPVAVVCALLGLPARDAPLLRAVGEGIASSFGPAGPAADRHVSRALGRWRDYWAEVTPALSPDGAVAELRDTAPPGFAAHVPYLVAFLVGAAYETTAALLPEVVLALHRHPAQARLLATRPELTGDAVEELLRHVSPAQFAQRYPTRDAVVDGVPVPAGQPVRLVLAAANRDPAVFADPAAFDVRRTGRHHLAFGAGAHYCQGAGLARMECALLIGELLARLPDLRPAGPARYGRNIAFRRLRSLPVRRGESRRIVPRAARPVRRAQEALR